MFKIGDLVTLARSNGSIIGFVTSVVDKTFVWVRWMEKGKDNTKSVIYSSTSLELVSYV
jgi:hypothetical protein